MRILRSLVSACMLLASITIGVAVQSAPAVAQEVTQAVQDTKPVLVAFVASSDIVIPILAVAAIVAMAMLGRAFFVSRLTKRASLIDGFPNPAVPRSPPD